MQRPNPQIVTLNEILVTEELFRRVSRTPNLQAENQAMRVLIQQMAQNSETFMQTLVNTALALCEAGTTGLSLLETTPDGEEIFRWHALAGTLAHHAGSSTPRNFSPCGVCLEQGTPVLFSHPEDYFPYFQEANIPIVEGLVLPLVADHQALGTIWIMSHDPQRQFDSEDVRVMTSLADFTATALLLQQRQTKELLAANAALEAEIAERKQAEARSQALMQNLPGGAAFVVDHDLRYLLAEGEALVNAGFKPEDFVGRTIFEVLPPEVAANYAVNYRKALAGEPFEVEHNAHNHTYISRGTPLRTEAGEIYAVLVVSYDITDRKHGEEALHESEARLQSIANLVPDLLWDSEPDGSTNWYNQRWMEYTGQTFEQAIGWGWTDAIHPDDREGSVQCYREAVEQGVMLQQEHRIRRHDGEYRWFVVKASPLKDESGKVVKMYGAATDIHDRKQVEDALRESEQKYRSLFESINDGFALLEVLYDDNNRPSNCRFLEVSPSFETQTGLPQAQGKTLRELIPSVESGWFEHYHQALVTNTLVHFEMQQKYLNIWFEVDVLPYGNPQDRRVVIVFRNINDRKQTEAERLQLIQEQSACEQERQRAESLAELDRTKTLFFTNISHEFRTPLTLSLAPLQDALSDRTHPLDPVHRERLELVHRNSLRLLKLVNTLLDFSRIEAGRIEALYEPTDLAMFTTELTSVFRSAIERAGLQLVVDCPPLPEPVYVDRGMWEKIVLNLLSNALKFTFEGEITVSLSVESRVNLRASTSNSPDLTSDPQLSASELDPLSSELDAPTSELDAPTSELDPLSSELDAPTSELDPLSSELDPLSSELDAPTSELDPLSSELDPLSSELDAPTSELDLLSSELDTPTLEKQATPSNLHVILKIGDSGTGIVPEHLPHLFERFYQVRGTQARTYEGSGIGLALVHELVKLHGGIIQVSSTLGEGTCFTIVLPFGTAHLPTNRIASPDLEDDRHQPTRTLASTTMRASTYVEEAERWLPRNDFGLPILEFGLESPEAASPDRNSDQLTNNPTSKIQNPKSKILLIDDNADIREYLSRILSEYVQVEAVADGATALAVVEARVPDLILSDVMMPGLNGFELLQALRTDPRTREIPIILLSARAGEEAIVEGLAAGADDYLIKPFSAQELVSRVMAHLQMAQLRSEALQQERMRHRQKDEFISTVSHELNTPLVSILGWTRLLQSNSPSPAILSKALNTIERNATLQAKLVQDLLDISRITAGKFHLNPQPIELQPVIETAIATVSQTAADKGIYLTWHENVTEPFVVMGDSDRLGQVFTNLLSNAIKFTPESGSVRVELSVMSAAANPPYAEIRVADTGIGIAADFLPYVFDRFRQAEGANAAKGLGLGLAIAYHIIELHNGTIQAQSAGEGQGATFIIQLPLLQPNP